MSLISTHISENILNKIIKISFYLITPLHILIISCHSIKIYIPDNFKTSITIIENKDDPTISSIEKYKSYFSLKKIIIKDNKLKGKANIKIRIYKPKALGTSLKLYQLYQGINEKVDSRYIYDLKFTGMRHFNNITLNCFVSYKGLIRKLMFRSNPNILNHCKSSNGNKSLTYISKNTAKGRITYNNKAWHLRHYGFGQIEDEPSKIKKFIYQTFIILDSTNKPITFLNLDGYASKKLTLSWTNSYNPDLLTKEIVYIMSFINYYFYKNLSFLFRAKK